MLKDEAPADRPSQRWVGASFGDVCKKPSHSPDACDRSKLSGIAVEIFRSSYSHPFRPCGRRRHCSRGVPLASGTSVAPLRRSPFVSAGRLLLPRLAARPLGSAGVLLMPRLGGWLPFGSAGDCWRAASGSCAPFFRMAGESMSGLRIPASDGPRGGSVLLVGADCRGVWPGAQAARV